MVQGFPRFLEILGTEHEEEKKADDPERLTLDEIRRSC